MEAIILAGGLGTRLKSVVFDVPKPMAPINGIPFLTYLLRWLKKNSVFKVILSVGYLKESIMDHYNHNYDGIEITYSIENEPLGTGGALKNAIHLIENKYFYLINGDTFFDVKLTNFFQFHIYNKFSISICLKNINNPERYSTVKLDLSNRIIEFLNDNPQDNSYINGGVYLINKEFIQFLPRDISFSFEKDFLSKSINKLNIGGFASDSYFIDIGIPKDYLRASHDLKF